MSAADRESQSEQLERGPVVGVGAFVEHDGRVLLVQRGKPPGEGLWAIPGGRQHHGESVAAAAEREVFEETSVRIRAHEMVYCFETMFDRNGQPSARVLHGPGYPPVIGASATEGQPAELVRDLAVAHHYIIIDLRGEYLSGAPQPGDDARDARWFTPAELLEMKLNAQIQAGTAAFLENAGLL